MRYPQDHKGTARQRLIEISGHHAKQHGFAESGMAALAASAGVTTGALYKHFDGKADLFVALIETELARTAQMYAAIDPANDADVLRSLSGYLSMAHVRHPEQGCPLPSLTPEIARASATARDAYQGGLREIHASVERLVGSAAGAWALMAQNVGAVMLARAASDESLQREILAAVRKAGENILSERGPAAPDQAAPD